MKYIPYTVVIIITQYFLYEITQLPEMTMLVKGLTVAPLQFILLALSHGIAQQNR